MRRHGSASSPILGIDPGSQNCGYGIITTDGAYVVSGTIVLSPKKPFDRRLKELYQGLSEVIAEHRPAEGAVEKIFFAKSVRSALSLGHARGVALLAVADGGLDLFEYTPMQVKKAVAGYGRAEKAQVQDMVSSILGINGALSPDGADALALALCHLQTARFTRALGRAL